MKRIIVAMLLCFCVTACAHMNITPISESAKKLDRAGKVQYAEVLENAGEMPDFEVINEKLDILNGQLTVF